MLQITNKTTIPLRGIDITSIRSYEAGGQNVKKDALARLQELIESVTITVA